MSNSDSSLIMCSEGLIIALTDVKLERWTPSTGRNCLTLTFTQLNGCAAFFFCDGRRWIMLRSARADGGWDTGINTDTEDVFFQRFVPLPFASQTLFGRKIAWFLFLLFREPEKNDLWWNVTFSVHDVQMQSLRIGASNQSTMFLLLGWCHCFIV